MMALPAALRIYTAVITILAQEAMVAMRYQVSACCQLPMKMVISDTNPLKPGSPREHKPAITNMDEMKGMIFNRPPS